MRGLAIFVAVVAILGSFVLVDANINNPNDKNSAVKEEIKNFKFSTFTSAICENSGGFVKCKDEVFVNCNGNISKGVDIAECNGLKLDIPKVIGSAVFEKGWKDERG